MYWASFRFVARDPGVRYMMAPSRTRSELVSWRAPLRVSPSSVDVGFVFIFSTTWLLAATKLNR